jgi:hypothetical protein
VSQLLGDSHNFGRRVTVHGKRVHKPRTLMWEFLLLGAKSPLRRALAAAAAAAGLDPAAFDFLPSLRFYPERGEELCAVERIELTPLPRPSRAVRSELTRVVGRALGLLAWFGIGDLHWENLVLGQGRRGQTVFGPLDIELALDDYSRPTETRLLPAADGDYDATYRHAAGVRRVLPYLGKPVAAEDLARLAGAYRSTLELLDRHASAIAGTLRAVPGIAEAPIRVLLRGTDEYVRARSAPVWPPLLAAEAEQLERGDIPYFFRLSGRPGIHYYADPSLRTIRSLPRRGDVPRLGPVLRLERGLRSPTRRELREEGLFALLAAFDHPSLSGTYESEGLTLTFRPRSLVVLLATGEELRAPRQLSALAGSVYLPCRCGEVRTVFVPSTTVCKAPPTKP